MKKKIIAFLFVLVYLFFIALLDYPYVARILNDVSQGEVITSYEEALDEVADVEDEMLVEAEKYNETLSDGAETVLDAFSTFKQKEDIYDTLLDVGVDGTMGTISIPSIDVFLPIYHGTSEDVLQKGAGHLRGTSLPVGGIGTHTCISAHRGLPRKTMFTNLDLLEEGDLFYITVLSRRLAYEVYSIEVVDPKNVDSLKIYSDKDIATLITCTPYGINSHRMYVHGKRVPIEDEEVQESIVIVEDPENWLVLNWWILVTILLLLLMVIILWYYFKPNKKDKKEERKQKT